jgi:hypothetical protein
MCFFRRYFLSIYGAIPKPRANTVQLLLTVECQKTKTKMEYNLTKIRTKIDSTVKPVLTTTFE